MQELPRQINPLQTTRSRSMMRRKLVGALVHWLQSAVRHRRYPWTRPGPRQNYDISHRGTPATRLGFNLSQTSAKFDLYAWYAAASCGIGTRIHHQLHDQAERQWSGTEHEEPLFVDMLTYYLLLVAPGTLVAACALPPCSDSHLGPQPETAAAAGLRCTVLPCWACRSGPAGAALTGGLRPGTDAAGRCT